MISSFGASVHEPAPTERSGRIECCIPGEPTPKFAFRFVTSLAIHGFGFGFSGKGWRVTNQK